MNIYIRTINTYLLCMLPCFAIANPNANEACDELAGLTIIGEVEYVTVIPHEFKFKARIDTGAEGSSLRNNGGTHNFSCLKMWVS